MGWCGSPVLYRQSNSSPLFTAALTSPGVHPFSAPTLNPSPCLTAASAMATAAASCAALQHAAFTAGPAPRRQRGAARRLQVAAQASSSSTSVSGVPDKIKPDWAGELERTRVVGAASALGAANLSGQLLTSELCRLLLHCCLHLPDCPLC